MSTEDSKAAVRSRLLTERLVMRPLERADLDELVVLHADPTLVRFVGDGTPATRAESAEWLDRHLAELARCGYGLMATELRADGEFVGRCGYKEWVIEGDPALEIGWMIARKHQREGYATEAGGALRDYAFESFDRSYLVSVIHPENEASLRVAEKLGGERWLDWVTPGGQPAVVYRYLPA